MNVDTVFVIGVIVSFAAAELAVLRFRAASTTLTVAMSDAVVSWYPYRSVKLALAGGSAILPVELILTR